MNSDEPLLLSSNKSSAVPNTPPKRLSSLGGCLCPTTSSSSSAFEDTPENSIEVEDDEVINNEKDVDGSPLGNSKFYSADSQYLDQFPQECTPRHRRRKRMVSWGGSMEIQQGPAVSDNPRAPSRAHESVNKSHRFRPKSMQFDADLAHEENPRLIYVNDPQQTNDKHEFAGNEVRTSKYTIINFLPKNLFLQFHRVAYLYFLAIAVLNQLPPLAVFGRTASLFPLLFVLCVTAIKDGYEDWRRHRSDRNENNRLALVHQLGNFEHKKWKHIRPGEVVKICADETIPCDMVLLGTSDHNGIAYIQTMNLDGESNLKTRYARQETSAMVLEGSIFSGIIRCEQPNRNIYEFSANMEVNELRFPLSQSNIILRGCQLKNTDWVVGVVVYAGQETKAMLNSAMTPAKRSRLETYMNRETLSLSVFLFIMCLVVSIGMCFWLLSHKDRLDTLPYYRKRYFEKGKKPGKTYRFYGIPMETFISFLSSIIVFQIMIPISLYITMELVRLGQSYFMIGDMHMFDSSSNSRFQCRSLNINEDLGQIRYVFSDKTGTLTENKMEFRTASIRGRNYGSPMLMADGSQYTDIPAIRPEASLISRRWMIKSNIDVNPELMALLSSKVGGDQRSAAHDFFLTLAACNTVVPILTRSPSLSCLDSELDEVVEAIDYQGESPDEQALVSAASAYGFTLFERTSGHVSIDVNGEELRLHVLGLHEFDSVRKRMSVVVRFPDNSVRVLVKGADSSMMSIVNENSAEDEDCKHATQSHLNEYSSEGLRTLVIAAKDLSEVELDEWQDMYEDASTSLTDRAIKLREAAALIECDLHLIGATAIEDKLQEGVPEAIESLREAGIKVWVLTGDKQETAISIGLSCKLLTSDMHRIVINGSSEKECQYLLTEAMAKYGVKSDSCKNLNVNLKRNEQDHELEISDRKVPNLRQTHLGHEGDAYNQPLALIIDGNSLVYILERDLENELFDLATSCRVVICCRVAPLQKAGIVDLIKSRTDDMTLAIGDGANDVSMIQMADVGVGICGQEGRQAVMASDFAMGQFRFLKRLLLVHGHWNYQRNGYLVLYNFYRNAVFVIMLFWYILYTGYSTTSALTDWSSMFYSIIYTSIPTIVVGILDKDLSDRTLLKYPKLYESGYRQESYNIYLFWGIMIDTFWQSLVLFYVPLFIYQESTIDIWSMGSLWTIAVVILVNVHLAMDIQRWLVLTHLAVWGSIVITYASIVVLDSIPIFANYWTIYHLAGSPTYWLAILLIIVLALLPRFVFKLIHLTFWPSDIQIAREDEVLGKRPKFIGPKHDKASG